jgi:predicted RNase H-like HicB family nuclease
VGCSSFAREISAGFEMWPALYQTAGMREGSLMGPLPLFASDRSSAIIELGASIAMEFTAVYMKVPEGYVAFVEELPGANTQGDTLEEARENLREAVEMVLEANRELAERSLAGKPVTREPFAIAKP